MGLATSRQALLEGSTVRNVYTGHSGAMGQVAARLVEAGFTGESNAVQSVFGRGVLADGLEPQRVVEGLGQEWVILSNYFKLHCTGRYVHSAIDALEDALRTVPGGRIDADTIERIEVKAYKLAASLRGKDISTSFGARFSVPFAIATILHHGKSELASFDEAAVANPAVQHLVSLVDVEEEPSYNDTYPQEQHCDIVIRLKNSATVHGHCRFTKGESTNPHAPGELQRKFFELGESVWGPAVTAELFDSCMRLESVGNVRDLAARWAL
jgi:2-methylcitrate dehydratase PrpD